MSCYIQQDDRIQGLLTVGENMTLAADLKLPTRMDKYEKLEVVSKIFKLKRLDLSKIFID